MTKLPISLILICLIIGLVAGILFTNYLNVKTFQFTIEDLIIFAIVIIGILIIGSTVVNCSKNASESKNALGMPIGSVRAMLALSLPVMFLFISVLFYMETDKKNELAEKILTTLGTLVVAISSFYFGTKATEQGSIITQNAYERARKRPGSQDQIPTEIILKAIADNKERWIEKYKCKDIKLGKKIVDGTSYNIQCIAFYVEKKSSSSDILTQIPSTISVVVDGCTYNIPTDVKDSASINDNNNGFIKLEKDKQYSIIQEYIDKNIDELIRQYPGITGAYVGKKKINQTETDVISLIFQVEEKSNMVDQLPKFINYQNYNIPTDIELASRTKPQTSSSPLNYGVKRYGDKEFGTLGFPVNYKDQLHILSCFHVFFNIELKAGQQSINQVDKNMPRKIVSLKATNNGIVEEEIGDVIMGEISNWLDTAIMKPNSLFLSKLNNEKLDFSYRTLIRNNERNVDLHFWGYGSKNTVTGTLENISAVQSVDYPGIGITTLRGLIQMKKCAVDGDSGSVVYDPSGKLVGLILGSDSQHTYAISAYNIFDKTDYKPYTINR